MQDRELLELAAKAAGIDVWFPRMNGGKAPTGERIILAPCLTKKEGITTEWNPLTDDGDALRLAVKLGLLIDCDNVLQEVEVVLAMRSHDDDYIRCAEAYGDDPDAATRRAIVRAAAAMA